jgi:hypothetical protein
MRMMAVLLCCAATGCATSRLLDKSALNHESRGQAYAESGDGERAEEASQRAADLRAEARHKALKEPWQHWTWVGGM